MARNGFNAFEYAMELKKAGVPEAQADLQARAMAQLKDTTAATTQDLEITKLELKRDIELVKKDIENVRAELKKDISELNASLTWKMVLVAGISIISLGALMTLLKFFS